jgi:hypothetical protein
MTSQVAEQLLDAASVGVGTRVLDVATGSTRSSASRDSKIAR